MNIISSRLSRLAVAAAAVMALPLWVGCSDLDDDDHYSNSKTEIRNPELKIVAQTSEDYIKSQGEYSEMYQLLTSADIFNELREKGQLATILMVSNDDLVLPASKADNDDELTTLIRSHVSDISVSPANLKDGDRLMMWHGKYVNITMDEEGKQGQIIDHVKFSNGLVKEVIQTSNGYIYVIDQMIVTPTSLSDYIDNLGDEYSIFRELVKASGGKEFLKAQSKPLYVNSEGNTVYDSVFRYTNEHFEAVGVDLNSESLTATMCLPSDQVIREALADAHERLEKWGLERSDSVLRAWILDVCFFKKRYEVADLSVPASVANPSNVDINSVFSKQWRKTSQVLETSGSEELSNGVVHKISKLHIPTNVLIYRLKEWFYYYENCTDVQKSEYFKMTNMIFKDCKVDVEAWTPLPGVWPLHEDRIMRVQPTTTDTKEEPFRLDFTPLKMVENEQGEVSIQPFLIPPGSYRLAFGSKQNQGITFHCSVLVDGNVVGECSEDIMLGASTDYHYDRGASLQNRYPEGYDSAAVSAAGGNSKAGNYDTDGGLLISEVTIPDVNGDGSAVNVVIRFDAANWCGQSDFTLCHWCLRPTVNCY